MRPLLLILLLTLRPLLAQETTTQPLANLTLVIYNPDAPGSADLARLYALKRHIPPDQLLPLPAPDTEEITRTQYIQHIEAPLRAALDSHGWWQHTTPDPLSPILSNRIRILCLIRGVPLKIKRENLPALADGPSRGINEASVDSELATIGLHPDSPDGAFNNPYQSSYTPITQTNIPGLLLVGRLDAPTPDTVLRIIQDSIATETRGRLLGRAYIDTRGLTEGPYLQGDDWLRASTDKLRRAGLPVLQDNRPATLPPGYPLTDAAIYLGWYDWNASGPFADTAPALRLPPGSIAVHIHSFSAATLRSPTANWCGPLLEHGAAATLGNVYEPYLTYTHRLDTFTDRLLAGFTLIEAAHMSLPVLSWMSTTLGDPLYRPFPRREPDAPPAPAPAPEDRPWLAYKQAIPTWFSPDPQGKPNATDQIQQAADLLDSPGLYENLALLQASDRHLDRALLTNHKAAALLTADLPARLRLLIEEADILRLQGHTDKYTATFLRDRLPTYAPAPQLAACLQTYINELDPPPPADPAPAP